MSYTHVDKPLRIGEIEIKNRIVRPAHGTVIGKGTMNDALIAYHEARARGGVALSILEVGSVHPSTAFCLNVFDPEIEAGMSKLVDKVAPHGMKLLQQLWHGGHHVLPADGSPPWAPSDVVSAEVGVVPQPMTKTMIDTIIGGYVDTALRVVRCGLEGVEVHCAHGYLPAQFLSKNTNLREDEYGGSFENRARFIMELLIAIRRAVPKRAVVGVRVAPDLTPGGLGVEENLRIVQMLEAQNLIDYVNISVGNYNSYTKMVGGMHEPLGYELPTSIPIARGSKSPSMVCGRFRTLEEADQVIRNGDADMVGLVRATIADPDLVAKSLAGKTEQVRPCIGCNQACVAQAAFIWMGMECAVNPGTGHELELGDHILTTATVRKRVLVIGGGPAGMEAARVAALRGHSVVLAEAAPDLGGTLRVAAKAPTRQSIGDIVSWLETEIFRLGVEVRLGTYMDANDVLSASPDAVIVATGSTPRMDGIHGSHPGQPIRGIQSSHVISSTDLFVSPPADLGQSVAVIDDVGHYEGLAAAEHLIAKGVSVTYVTRLRGVAPLAQPALMNEPFLTRMQNKPFRYLIRTRAIAIEPGFVLVGPTHLTDDAVDTHRIPADSVVFISNNRPNRELYAELAGRVAELHVVGDANSPRFLQTAIREGNIAGTKV